MYRCTVGSTFTSPPPPPVLPLPVLLPVPVLLPMPPLLLPPPPLQDLKKRLREAEARADGRLMRELTEALQRTQRLASEKRFLESQLAASAEAERQQVRYHPCVQCAALGSASHVRSPAHVLSGRGGGSA